MTDNERLFLAYDFLKKEGLIKTYTELAQVLGSNKAGVNDLKNGNKKVTIDNIRSMVKSYPQISIQWLILEDGGITNNNFTTSDETENTTIATQNKLIQMQEKEIARLEKELELLKATGHEKSKSRTAVEFRDEPKPELKK